MSYTSLTDINSKSRAKPFLNTPLIIALDVDDENRAYQLADELAEVAGAFKLGPRLIHRFGQQIVKRISANTPVFVDCKFFDIPSTMDSSVRACFEAGATFATIHAGCGRTALERMAKLEAELNQQRPFKILAVTILTSWGPEDFPASYNKDWTTEDHVESLAKEARQAGLKGLVCSPLELRMFKGSDHYIVTPGIRVGMDSYGDQTRVLGPQEAIEHGASAFVVGRPIVEAENPLEAALTYAVEALK